MFGVMVQAKICSGAVRRCRNTVAGSRPSRDALTGQLRVSLKSALDNRVFFGIFFSVQVVRCIQKLHGISRAIRYLFFLRQLLLIFALPNQSDNFRVRCRKIYNVTFFHDFAFPIAGGCPFARLSPKCERTRKFLSRNFQGETPG